MTDSVLFCFDKYDFCIHLKEKRPKIANVLVCEKAVKRWLTNREAAEFLAVDERTIKRWMLRQETREALLAVRHENGKQWRIPRPNDLGRWNYETRARFNNLDMKLGEPLERELEQLAKKCGRYLPESCRLWLAASIKAVERRDITQETRDQILTLWQTANEVLESQPRHRMKVEKLRDVFFAALKSRGLRTQEIEAVMSRWPDEKHFEKVREARTMKKLETIRWNVDFAQAICELEQMGQRPTAKNWRPLLHKDMATHINDTREKLPASILDMRQPQAGLKRHSARLRHPKKSTAVKSIIAVVYEVLENIPGTSDSYERFPCRKSVGLRADE